MMCRLFHSIPRGLRHKAQGNAAHTPWAGNSSQQSRQQEDNVRSGIPPSDGTETQDKRLAHVRRSERSQDSLVRQTQWKWNDGWKSFTKKNPWSSYERKGSNYTSQDALGWGTALMVSLQLARVLTAASLPDDSTGGKKKKILASVADRLPVLWYKPIRDTNLLSQKQQQGETKATKTAKAKRKTQDQESPQIPLIAAAVAELQVVTNQSVGQAHNSLGVKLAREGRLEEATGHFMEGSKMGFSRATFNLGVSYEQGRGVGRDLEKAADLYRRASDQGHPLAKFNLGMFHLRGAGGVQQDTALALDLISSAAAAGVKQANRYLGIHFLENKQHRDEEKAATFLQKAVDKQDTDAQYQLGLCYEHGWGVAMNTAKAASLYHRATQNSHPEALYSLARFHELGLGGLPINRESATLLYQEAHKAGNEKASEYLKQLQSDPTAATNYIDHRGDVSSHTDNEKLKVLHTGVHKSSTVNNKELHVSHSAPNLKELHGKDNDIPTKDGILNGKFSISHLSLFLNLHIRPSAGRGHRSDVTFQVGDEEVNERKSDDVAVCHSVGTGHEASTPLLQVS